MGNGKYGPHFECGIDSLEHGWPCTFLSHDGVLVPTSPGPSSAVEVSAWQIGDHAQFNLGFLAFNVCVLIVGTPCIFWFVRQRLRRHGWRFGLRELLLATCGVAVIAAFVNYRLRINRAQRDYLRAIDAKQQVNVDFLAWQPFGPYWLRSLTGYFLWDWGDQLVEVYDDDLAAVPGKSSIKSLRLEEINCRQLTTLQEFANLLTIDMCFGNFLNESGESEIVPCLQLIAQRKSIEGLNLWGTGVTDRGLQELVAMKNLKNLELGENDEITDQGLVHLASLKSLRRLGLDGTNASPEGVARLRAALPDCEIEFE